MSIKLIVFSIILSFATACTAVPEQEFSDYTKAFSEAKVASEKIILEYDSLLKARSKDQAPIRENAEILLNTDIDITSIIEGPSAFDPITARRKALEVLDDYNSVLTALAAGQEPEQFKAKSESLGNSLNIVLDLFSDDIEIPYVSEAAGLAGTLLSYIEEANNREEFIAALELGEPLIEKIILQLAADAQEIELLRRRIAQDQTGEMQEKVSETVRGIRSIFSSHQKSNDIDYAEWEADLRLILDSVDLNDKTLNSAKITTGSESSNPAISATTIVQLQQSLIQAQGISTKYNNTLDEAIAFKKMVLTYGNLLAATKSSLRSTLLAVNAKPNLQEEALVMINLGFELERNWNDIQDARKSTN